ncbi:PHP domain-containing protein [Ornithinicoccus halotolerans]|uniref:PHP domain-containing protein n=1 Tax=Ornithinicoccus halotolerans TaxID=1748220 RepID=UPI001294A7BA|nr:PHP domain-containing protein [Ornithinicoccus halotolerans]
MVIDLHTHSRHSDGTDTPGELVAAAAAAGVRVVALTDHDAATGWDEADRAGREHGVTVVPGIELSCRWRGVSVHLLGYLFDPQDVALLAETGRARRHRVTRIEQMAQALADAGWPVSVAQVHAQAGAGATLGRPHLADALVAAGVYPDREAAFADVLHGNSRFYVGHYAPDVVAAVAMLRAAGGVPVMAHPFAAARGTVVGDDAIEAMVRAGLLGLEVDHRDHDAAAVARGERLCDRWGLLRTGASDYHGRGKPNRLGERTTDPAVLTELVAAGTGSPLLGAPLPSPG